jgi:hypothetical protein
MGGRGSLSGLLPFKDANGVVIEMADEVLPVRIRPPSTFSIESAAMFNEAPYEHGIVISIINLLSLQGVLFALICPSQATIVCCELVCADFENCCPSSIAVLLGPGLEQRNAILMVALRFTPCADSEARACAGGRVWDGPVPADGQVPRKAAGDGLRGGAELPHGGAHRRHLPAKPGRNRDGVRVSNPPRRFLDSASSRSGASCAASALRVCL